jgi:hypothetical protein
MKNKTLNGFNDGLHRSSGVGGKPDFKLGKEVVEYCKQYEGTDKYDVAMLAIAKGYELGEEDLEASVKKHALGFAEWLNIHEYMLINKIWFHIGHVTNLTTEKLFDNYLRKLRE